MTRGRGLLVAVALVATACSHGRGKATASTTTVPAATTTTATPDSSLPTLPPTTTATTTAPTAASTAGGATVLGPHGALLSAPPPPGTQSNAPEGADCHSLGDPGWTVSACASFTFPDATRAWLVEERTAAGGAKGWRVYVLHFSQGKGAWLMDLWYKDDTGTTVNSAKVVTADLTRTGKASLVVGFRYPGSGAILAYDVVANFDSGASAAPTVAFHRELPHGQASVETGQLVDYAAQYPNGEPNCCPAYFIESRIAERGGRWVATPAGRVPNAGAGDF